MVLEQMPIFSFPAGANAGNFMHDVFEHLDFRILQIGKNTSPKNWKTISTSRKKWTSAIYEMVTEVMQTELEKGFSLSLLKKCDRLEEMEFYFPTSSGFLPELAQRIPQHSKLKKYLDRINAEDYRKIEGDGYLKG